MEKFQLLSKENSLIDGGSNTNLEHTSFEKTATCSNLFAKLAIRSYYIKFEMK